MIFSLSSPPYYYIYMPLGWLIPLDLCGEPEQALPVLLPLYHIGDQREEQMFTSLPYLYKKADKKRGD